MAHTVRDSSECMKLSISCIAKLQECMESRDGTLDLNQVQAGLWWQGYCNALQLQPATVPD